MNTPPRSQIPKGVPTFLPAAADEKRRLETALFGVFAERGYREVIPPTFEYLEVLAPGLDGELIEKSYKVVDRATGRILVLRPDATAQIARMVGMGMLDPGLPLRLYYSVNIFRYEPEHAGRDREIFQIGVELIGARGPAADAEPVILAGECLKRLGVPRFTIAVGHGGFFQGLLRRTGLPDALRRELREAAGRKDTGKMAALLSAAGVRGSHAKALLAIPFLLGGPEVLDTAGRLAPHSEDCRRSLNQLREVGRQVSAAGLSEHLLFDMGDVRKMEYYTGLVFDIYAEGVGGEIGGGGRYDHLIGRFGRELPATGFAFDLDRLLQLNALWPVARPLSSVGLTKWPNRESNRREEVPPATPLRSADHAPGRQPDQTLKLPPQNVEAEQAVLGAILLDNQALYKTLEILDPDEFYRPVHKRIFTAMVALSEENQVIDLLTLTDHLRRAEALEAVGGTAYLTDLAQSVATAAGVGYHARMVHETAISRSLIVAATEIVTRGYEGTRRVDELLDFAERSIFGIAERRLKRLFTSMQDVIASTVQHIDQLYNRKEKITGIPTGFSDLDERTAGLQPSDLIIIAGRPSMGKTSLALGMALNAALNRTRPYTVAIFSLEMSKEQLCMRLLSAAGSLNMHRIRTGHLNEDEWKTLARTASLLHDSRIYIDDTPAITVLEMGAKIRRLRAEHGLDLVVVDYLQLMSGGGNSENRQQEISDISRSLKSVAKELNIPVVALSQLSRAVENRPSKRPLLSDLRESGAIEQDADLVMMIYRSEMYAAEVGDEDDENRDEEHVAEILIAKHRNGPTGTAKLTFLPEYARFGNYQNPAMI